MDQLDGTPDASLFSPLYPKHAKLIKSNEMIKHLVFETYNKTCQRQLNQFVELFDNMLTSTFSNPWVFLKGATSQEYESDDLQDAVLPSFEDTKDRVPKEIHNRSGTEAILNKWLTDIPSDSKSIDEAVDQVELFSESFFKLPILRRLEEDMAIMELSEEDT